MFKKYFANFLKKAVKKSDRASASKKTSSAVKKGVKAKPRTESKKTSVKIDMKSLKESLSGIIPANLAIDSARPVDAGGFAPDGADLLIFHPYCRDIVKIMDGCVPFSIVRGAVFAVDNLDKKNLQEVVNRVSGVKKLSMYSDEESGRNVRVPSFVIAGGTSSGMMEIKNDILNYYTNNNIDSEHEFDIMMIADKGIIVKNWREPRSFIALETQEDTMMWFFILMNEYLDVKSEVEIDFRKYVRTEKTYREY